MVKDGVPCIVIRVDQTGEHGIAMSLLPTNKARRTAARSGDRKWFFTNRPLDEEQYYIKGEYYAQYFHIFKRGDAMRIRTSGTGTGTRITTTRKGREALQNVITFCRSKDVDMEFYFPEYYWATTLGSDWFIPGADELRDFIRILGYGGFGEEYSKGVFNGHKGYRAAVSAFRESVQRLTEAGQGDCFADVNTDISVYYDIILSSTLAGNSHADDIGPLSLVKLSQEATGKEWWDMAHIATSAVCAMCEF